MPSRNHPVIAIAEKLGARRAASDLELAVAEPATYVTPHACASAGSRSRRSSCPGSRWSMALVDEKLATELDHRTFPEDVMDALDGLRSMPKRRGRWTWAKEVDEGTSTADFLALAAHPASSR